MTLLNIFISSGHKKRRVPSVLAFSSGYRQATFTYNKHGTIHAIERELSYCLSSYVEYWRYSMKREQELKSSIYLKMYQNGNAELIYEALASVLSLSWIDDSLNRQVLSVSFLKFIFYFLFYSVLKGLTFRKQVEKKSGLSHI